MVCVLTYTYIERGEVNREAHIQKKKIMLSTTSLRLQRYVGQQSRLLPNRRYLSVSSAGWVKHVVMFRFKPEASEMDIAAIQLGLLDLPKKLPQIRDYELGVDLFLESGQNHPSGPNRELAWSATFASVEDYLTYNDSPEHIDFLQTLKPVVEPGSRAAIQYKVPPKL